MKTYINVPGLIIFLVILVIAGVLIIRGIQQKQKKTGNATAYLKQNGFNQSQETSIPSTVQESYVVNEITNLAWQNGQHAIFQSDSTKDQTILFLAVPTSFSGATKALAFNNTTAVYPRPKNLGNSYFLLAKSGNTAMVWNYNLRNKVQLKRMQAKFGEVLYSDLQPTDEILNNANNILEKLTLTGQITFPKNLVLEVVGSHMFLMTDEEPSTEVLKALLSVQN